MGTASAPSAEGSTTKSSSKTVTKASAAGTKAKKPAPRRKKPTAPKTSSASSNQATYSAARAAQMELAGQRSAAAARLSDPLWYRIEDVLSATQEESSTPATAKVLPEQVQIVEAALSNNNMTRSDVTPQAFCVLLEQARRYALELIADAQDYAITANRNEIAKADLELASIMRPDHPMAVTTQLPKLNLLAQRINRIPLPPIPTQCYSGVLLPPKRHQLTARTYDVVSGAQVAQRMVQPKPFITTRRSSSSSGKAITKPSYGAARGRQIPIALKEKQPESKDAPTGTAPPAPSAASSTSGSSTPVPASTGPAPMEISSPTPASSAPAATSESNSPVPTAAPPAQTPPAAGPAPATSSPAAPAPPPSQP